MASRQPFRHDDIDGDASSSEGQAIEKSGNPEKTTEHHVDIGEVQELAEKLGDKDRGLAPVDDIEWVMDKIDTLTIDQCRTLMEKFLKDHEYDYNLANAQREKIQGLLVGPAEGQSNDEWELALKTETAINRYYSPYPEVRAVTTPEDDQSILCETWRAHFLGYAFAVIAQFVNSLFNSRFPQIFFLPSVAQVLLYPCGLALQLLPDWGFTIKGKRYSLNPGPWTYKEQMLSTIIVNVCWTSAYVFWNIQTQEIYYKDKWLTPGYKILLLLSTQLLGLGFAGLLRRFVVYPTEALWPSVLPTLALNRALLVPEKKETIHGWSMSRYKFFFIIFGGMFVYFWLPGYLFNALSFFAWMTWIKPNNFNLGVVTGSQFGLGFNPISSFDWNVFGTVWYPLTWPFFSYAQQYIGTFLGGLIILAMYFSNYKWSGYLPPNSSGIFDNTGARYNISLVQHQGVLNETAYQEYSPAFYSAGNILLYGAFFTFYPLTFVFIILDFWKPIWRSYKQMSSAAWKQVKRVFRSVGSAVSSLAKGNIRESASHIYHMMDDESSVYDGFDDPFTEMMRKYPEVPDWWFLIIALVSFIFAIIILTVYPELSTPVWTIFFVVALNLVFLIPMTYLFAIAGTTEGLNVITELVVGYALPGHPEALMFVKAYGYNINGQADWYTSDQKMGQYAKIPPRAMYRGQVFGSIIAAFVAYGVVNFVDNDIKGICTPDQPSKFNCAAGSQVYFSSSVVWGAIGPKKIFSEIYPELKYTFLLGFLLAIFWWGIKRAGPSMREKLRAILPRAIFAPLNAVLFIPMGWLKQVHPSLLFNGMIYWAPYNLTYFTSGLYFSFGFMYWLKRYRTAWWEKYTYVLSAALTGGVAFSALILFFAVQFNPKPLPWWGNNVLGLGVDGGAETAQGALLTDLPSKGYFGPDTWT